MTGYDSWLEAPRASADRAAEWEELIDERLGDEYDRACRTNYRYLGSPYRPARNVDDVVLAISDRPDCDTLLRNIVLAAHGQTSDTVDGAVHRMIEAGRQAYIADQANRRRASEDMEGSNHD